MRAVFLDRDGVINRAVVRDSKPYPPASVADVDIPPGTAEALMRLRNAGCLLIVVTNQPDVADGLTSKTAVEEIHEFLQSELPIDAFYACYHRDRDLCECRKPKPGMILKAAEDYRIDTGKSYMIGDRWRDVDAGTRAGCATILIDYGYNERSPESKPWATVLSLEEAVTRILADTFTFKNEPH